MLSKFVKLESWIKVVLFFASILVASMLWFINVFNEIERSIKLLNEGETVVNELVTYRNLTINAFLDKQFEKFNDDPSDLKKADIQLMSVYKGALNLTIEQKYKIETILLNAHIKDMLGGDK